MTVREKLFGMLVNYGMFEKQAESVMELAIPVLSKQMVELDGNINQRINHKEEVETTFKIQKPYHITFDRPANEYPDIMYVLWFKTIRPVALKWIDDNIPAAWYREMFVGE